MQVISPMFGDSVLEFGIPTSRSMSHAGPLGRHQGGHNETEQGYMLAGSEIFSETVSDVKIL